MDCVDYTSRSARLLTGASSQLVIHSVNGSECSFRVTKTVLHSGLLRSTEIASVWGGCQLVVAGGSVVAHDCVRAKAFHTPHIG